MLTSGSHALQTANPGPFHRSPNTSELSGAAEWSWRRGAVMPPPQLGTDFN
jgi:hypothetical protein